MKNTSIVLLLAVLLTGPENAQARSSKHLAACLDKQAGMLKGKYIALPYAEQLNELYHSPEPWMQLHYEGKGTVWFNEQQFYRFDTLVNGKRIMSSKRQINGEEFLLLDYNKNKLSEITQSRLYEELIETARYTPVPLLHYFSSHKVKESQESNTVYSIFRTSIGETIVTLYIRNTDDLVVMIKTLSNDDLRGDVENIFSYENYRDVSGVFCPQHILIQKMNKKIEDKVVIDLPELSDSMPHLLDRPNDYAIKADAETKTTISSEAYNDHIHFVNVLPSGSKVMIVEFKDFLLVSEAPLNSSNGEQIIREAAKIAPGKPIRYFSFSHHHPDYTGGMRPFIHKGATVLCVPEDEEYISFLASAAHTIKPDSLQLQRKPLKMEAVKDSTTITDGNYAMKIYFIGKKSGHTNDYLIFYFPEEKLLIEGDLIWISKKGPVQKASARQAGLYEAIKDLRLEVKTIIQSWGIALDDYKTVIPFEDIEASVQEQSKQ